MTEVQQDVAPELSVKEEYQLWRKNCRYMYEFVSETALTWPSLTVQWLPEHTEDNGVIDAKLLLGTHTSGEDNNYLKVATTQLPASGPDGASKANSRIRITKKYENAFEINRARYMPQDASVVATINGEGHVDLYSLKDDSKQAYQHLTPHTANGYGLAWNAYKQGYLLLASDDTSVALTDINNTAASVLTNKSHGDIVNDAKWHHFDENLFGSVSDDKYTYIFDIRTPAEPALKYYNGESNGINSISFSPFSRHLIATGGANSNLWLLDMRRMTNRAGTKDGLLHTMMGHSDSITSLEFSPHHDGILALGSQDRRVILWDLFKIGEEQQQEDAEDGCPELFMMHAGHTGAVSDLAWCPYQAWTLASVADDNIVHLWQVGLSLLDDGWEDAVDLE